MDRLKSLANNSIEQGSINPNSTNAISIQGTVPSTNSILNDSSIDLFGYLQNNSINSIDGFIHTHSPTSEPIFSISDIASIGLLESNGQISNVQNFIFSLTTGRGDSYALLIDDITMLRSYFTENFSSQEKLDNVSRIFLDERASLVRAKLQSGQTTPSENDYKKSSEAAMLSVLQNSGLILVKQKNNGKWQKLERLNSENPRITKTTCN